ncbi:MAG: aldo/keto reductase, partial [Candidatus Latescibacterota bacterium]|nr:aldo/keto reductase [Candidatus Latescibacterota bacterium]
LRAFELGVNYVDTAPTYRDSEEVLGRVLPGVDTPCYLSTKIGGRPQPFAPQNPDHLRQSVEESLRLLKRDHIDLLMVHEPERPGFYDWWTDRDNYIGPVLDVLDELKERGIIRFTGVGGTTAYAMAPILATGRFDVVLTAFNYSLLWREAEHAILPTAKKLGMGIVIGSPLQQGVLSRRHDEEVQAGPRWMSPPRRAQLLKLYALLDEIDMSLPEISLRFVLSNPDISCTLMGARSAAEVELNIAAADRGPLASEILQRLDEIAAMVPFRPTEEPSCLPLGRDYGGLGPVR